MKVQWKPEQLWKLLDKYKYVLLVLAAGLILLLTAAEAGERAGGRPAAGRRSSIWRRWRRSCPRCSPRWRGRGR